MLSDKKKPKKAKAKGRSDEDLFGNTDDIFGDIPTKPKTAKGKKKKKTTTKTVEVKEGVATTEAPPTEGMPIYGIYDTVCTRVSRG